MILGIVALSILAGGLAAAMALFSGHSILFALAIYSGSGTVCALFIVLIIAGTTALRSRKPAHSAADFAA